MQGCKTHSYSSGQLFLSPSLGNQLPKENIISFTSKFNQQHNMPDQDLAPNPAASVQESAIVNHVFKDTTSEDETGYDLYKLPKDSFPGSPGHAYTLLSNDTERLAFMKTHGTLHRNVQAQWVFYEDLREGKRYNILIRSKEGEEVEELMGDSDEEREEEQEEVLLRYFREHAHNVEELPAWKRGECGEETCENISESSDKTHEVAKESSVDDGKAE